MYVRLNMILLQTIILITESLFPFQRLSDVNRDVISEEKFPDNT